MRKLIILFFLIFYYNNIKASPQMPDYFIIGKDTFSIYFLPLHHLDSTTLKTFFDNLKSDSISYGFTFSLWRGYQAYWKLDNDSLYLIGLKGFSKSDDILRETFPDNYKNGKVFANWFSSYLAIGKSKMLKWDGIFGRTYFKDEIFNFKNGILTNQKLVDNYIRVNNGISRLDSNRKNITDTIFSLIKKLNWKRLSECDCDDRYIVYVGELGKIDNIELLPYTSNRDTALMEIKDHKKCIRKFKRQLKKLQFDIVNWNGKPYQEKYYIELFYTVEGELENLTN